MKSLKILLSLLMLALFVSSARAAVTLTTLHSFTGPEGANPVGLLQGRDGNFYGTTEFGGTGAGKGNGTVFKMLPDGTRTTLHSFAGDDDGAWPKAGLAQGPDGTLYGTTTGGGLVNWGTMFAITPAGDYSSLTPFAAGVPASLLVLGRDGNFYGTALFGGEYGLGTLFSATPDGSVNVLVSFDGTNGWNPNTLLRSSDGNFYGTTVRGGPDYAAGIGYGTFFKLTSDGAFTSVYSFHNKKGVWPSALVGGADGYFYGTTQYGEATFSGYNYVGTVFKLTPGGEHTLLASFFATNGSFPVSLMQATDGNFYGTTRSGTGNAKYGTIFKVTPDGILTSLFLFHGTNGVVERIGSYGEAPLIQTAEDTFYGVTYAGGASNLGTVFRLQITPDPPRLDNISQNGSGGLTFSWIALQGRSYQVQFKGGLTQTNWTDAGGPITATNTSATATDVIGPDRQRFYRVVLLP